MKILITSGGTKVGIDMVRSITNMSRGTFGSEICREFIKTGDQVDFLMAEGSRTPFKLEFHYTKDESFKTYSNEYFQQWLSWTESHSSQYREYTYKTFEQYHDMVLKLLKDYSYDAIILAAAVSDYGVDNYVDGKIRSNDALTIKLKPYPKIISEVNDLQPNTFLVGFKLLVKSTEEELLEAAKDSLNKNKCSMVVANDLSDIKADNHKLTIVTFDKVMKFNKSDCEMIGVSLASELVHVIRAKYREQVYTWCKYF